MSTIQHQLHTFMGHLLALIGQGYTVEFEPDESVPARGARFWAHVCRAGVPETMITAEGDSPWAALWNASPLHGDADPLPPLPCGAELDGVHCTEPAHAKGHHYGPDTGNGVRKMWLDGPAPGELHAEMDVITGRVAVLEEMHGGKPGVESDHEEILDRLNELENKVEAFGKHERTVAALVHVLVDEFQVSHRGGYSAKYGFEPRWSECAAKGCGDPFAGHWEVAGPGGPRRGCAVTGCACTGWTSAKAAERQAANAVADGGDAA